MQVGGHALRHSNRAPSNTAPLPPCRASDDGYDTPHQHMHVMTTSEGGDGWVIASRQGNCCEAKRKAFCIPGHVHIARKLEAVRYDEISLYFYSHRTYFPFGMQT